MEAPRSQCYLATCLRLAVRAKEALVIVHEALTATEAFARWNDVVTRDCSCHLASWSHPCSTSARGHEGLRRTSSRPQRTALRPGLNYRRLGASAVLRVALFGRSA